MHLVLEFSVFLGSWVLEFLVGFRVFTLAEAEAAYTPKACQIFDETHVVMTGCFQFCRRNWYFSRQLFQNPAKGLAPASIAGRSCGRGGSGSLRDTGSGRRPLPATSMHSAREPSEGVVSAETFPGSLDFRVCGECNVAQVPCRNIPKILTVFLQRALRTCPWDEQLFVCAQACAQAWLFALKL